MHNTPLKRTSKSLTKHLQRINYFTKQLIRKTTSLPLLNKILIGSVATAVVAVGVVAAIMLSSRSQTPPPYNINVNNKPPATVASCTLPKVDVKANAFSVGVPKGWIYELNNGTVSIMKDTANTLSLIHI